VRGGMVLGGGARGEEDEAKGGKRGM